MANLLGWKRTLEITSSKTELRSDCNTPGCEEKKIHVEVETLGRRIISEDMCECCTLLFELVRSKQFSDFIAKCLDKNVDTRPTAQELLQHPWLADANDNKPIKQLLLEAKADLEVTYEDLPEDQQPQDDKSSVGSFDQLSNHAPSSPVTPAPPIPHLSDVFPANQELTPIPKRSPQRELDRRESLPRDDVDANGNDELAERTPEVDRVGDNVTAPPPPPDNKTDEISMTTTNQKGGSSPQPGETAMLDASDTNNPLTHSNNQTVHSLNGSSAPSVTKIFLGDPSALQKSPSDPGLSKLDAEVDSNTPSGVVKKGASEADILNQTPAEDKTKQLNSLKKTLDVTRDQKGSIASRSSVLSDVTTDSNEGLDGLSTDSKRKSVEPAKPNFKTLKKTRKFVMDGKVVTMTTSRVVKEGSEDQTRRKKEERKKELREMRRLRQGETKELNILASRILQHMDQLKRKQESEKNELLRKYTTETETLNKQQKNEVEKLENSQQSERRTKSKQLRQQQDREYKQFKENQKKEAKLRSSKGMSREEIKKMKEETLLKQEDKETQFLTRQNSEMENFMKNAEEQHKIKVCELEHKFLKEKHQKLRARESAIWEMEERHLKERHQIEKNQLKDMFYLQRHHMVLRQDRETEQLKIDCEKEDQDMKQRHTQKMRRLPRDIRAESKTRKEMFKKKVHIEHPEYRPDQESQAIKEFEENEKKRQKSEVQKQEMKHKKQLDDLSQRHAQQHSELQSEHNEKRKTLMEQETQKLREKEQTQIKEIKEWKENLRPRKKKLEDTFRSEMSQQDQFYATEIPPDHNDLPDHLPGEDHNPYYSSNGDYNSDMNYPPSHPRRLADGYP